MADGDAYKFDPVSIAPMHGQKWIVLVVFFLALLMAAEVPAEADFKEDKGAVLAVEGVDFRGRVCRHSSSVDDVWGHPRSGLDQAVQVFLR